MATNVEALIEGGKATAGPPLGPALGPTGVNTAQVIAKINEKTKSFTGMKVPITVIINDDKTFDIKVGTPPMSALIKSELGLASGSSNNKATKVGNLTIEQAKKIADMKKDDLLGATVKARVMEVAGNCICVGVTVDGKDPKIFQKDVKAGVYDQALAG